MKRRSKRPSILERRLQLLTRRSLQEFRDPKIPAQVLAKAMLREAETISSWLVTKRVGWRQLEEAYNSLTKRFWAESESEFRHYLKENIHE
jgi:hypothetical protein